MAMYLRELTIRYGTARAGDGSRVQLPVGEVVASPREVASLLHPLLAHEPVEVFSVLCLSVKHRIVGYAPISRRTLDSTIVHPREVFRAAILSSAAALALIHNHPSGDPARRGLRGGWATLALSRCPLQGFASGSRIGVPKRARTAIRRDSRPRFSGAGCVLPRFAGASGAEGRGFESLRAYHS